MADIYSGPLRLNIAGSDSVFIVPATVSRRHWLLFPGLLLLLGLLFGSGTLPMMSKPIVIVLLVAWTLLMKQLYFAVPDFGSRFFIDYAVILASGLGIKASGTLLGNLMWGLARTKNTPQRPLEPPASEASGDTAKTVVG